MSNLGKKALYHFPIKRTHMCLGWKMHQKILHVSQGSLESIRFPLSQAQTKEVFYLLPENGIDNPSEIHFKIIWVSVFGVIGFESPDIPNIFRQLFFRMSSQPHLSVAFSLNPELHSHCSQG